MKALNVGFVATTVALLCGCGGTSSAVPKSAAIDRAIEVQIGVGSPFKSGVPINSGEFNAVSTCVLPVNSTGGPGQVVCNTDGTIVRMRWDNVREVKGAIVLEGFNWAIDNWIQPQGGSAYRLGDIRQQVPNSQRRAFSTEMEELASCEIDTTGPKRTGRRLVVRARLLPETPTASLLQITK